MDFIKNAYIDYHYPVKSGIQDEEFLSIVEEEYPQAIRAVQPDLIVYNAGTDILLGDPLGAMRITEKGIIQRDRIVFEHALKNKIPIVMLLSGGYTRQSAHIIGASIANIVKNVIPNDFSQKRR